MKVRYRQLLAFLLIALSLIMILLARPFAVFSDEVLFEPLANDMFMSVNLDTSARRARPVAVNWSTLRPQSTQIKLNLFEDVVLTAVRQRVDTSPAIEGYVWVGRVLGQTNSDVALSVSDNVLAGSVAINGSERYTIRYSIKEQAHIVSEVDPDAYLQPTAPDFIVPAVPIEAADSAAAASCEDGSEIDLLVAYTAAARDLQGGQAAIEALINQRVSTMNTANHNSLVNFELNLVQIMEVNYTESGDFLTDLDRLKNPGDGFMDGVHAARDASKADLVGLYIAEGSGGACGMAYQMNPAANWFEAFAFGVSALDYPAPYNCSPLTLAHEFGHNLGNAHDRAHSGSVPYLPYAYGYQAPDHSFRTIMSYDCPSSCERINHWSNPDVFVGGQPTGVDYETNPGQAADNARALNEVAQVVANFRSTCAAPTETATPSPTVTEEATTTPTVTLSPEPTATDQAPSTATATLIPPPTTTSSPEPSPTPLPSATTTPVAKVSPTATQPSPTSIPPGSPTPTLRAATPTIIPPTPFFHAFIPFTTKD